MITVTDPADLQNALDQRGWVYVSEDMDLGPEMPLRIYGGTRLTVNATITRNANIAGMLMNGDDGQNLPGYDGHSDIIVEGGVWDVRGADFPGASGCMSFVHGRNITVRDCEIRDVRDHHAIEVNAIKGARIRDVRFAGFVDSGDREYAEAIQVDGAYSVDGWNRWGPYDKTGCDDILVEGCRFGASGTPGTQAWGRSVGSHGTPPAGEFHTDIKITGCRMDGMPDSGLRAWYWDGVLISGNTFRGCGISVLQSRNVTVTGNQVYDAEHTGVWVNSNSTQVAVSNNLVIGSGSGTNNSDYGIRVSTGCSLVHVWGNQVRKRPTGNSAKFGLSIADGSGMQHFGNDLRSSGVTGPLQDLSTAPITSASDAV